MEVNNAVKGKISVNLSGTRMAFDRFHNAASGSDSYFSPYKHQTGVIGDNGRLCQPYIPLPEFPLPEEPPLPYTPWATQDDPYQLIECAQTHPKNRNITDGNDCGSETDLYGLVSNILEEADSPLDSYFTEETPSSLKSVWSPKSMREGSLQYFQPSPVYPEPLGKGPGGQPVSGREPQQRAAELYPCFNGFDTATDPSWLFTPCNGESEAYYPLAPAQDLPRPPGLEVPPAVVSSYLSTARAGKPEYGGSCSEPGRDDGFVAGSNTFPPDDLDGVVGDPCGPPNKTGDPSSSSYFVHYPDYSALSRSAQKPRRGSGKPGSFSTPDANKLASSVQALLLRAGEESVSAYNRGRDTAQSRATAQRYYADGAAEPKGFPYPRMPAFDGPPSLQFKREPVADFGGLRAAELGSKKQEDFSSFGQPQQHAEYFQPSKSFSPSFTPQGTAYSNKLPLQRGANTPQTSLSQYAPHHASSNSYQSQAKQVAKVNVSGSGQGLSKLLSHSGSEFVPLLASQQRGASGCLSDFVQVDGLCLQGRAGQGGAGLEGLRKGPGAPGDGAEFDLHQERSRIQAAAAAAGLMGEGRSPQRFDGKARTHQAGGGMPREADRKQGLLQNPYLEFLGNMYARHGSVNSAKPPPPPPPPFFPPYLYQVGGGDPRQGACHLFSSPRHTGAAVPLMELCDLLPDAGGDFAAFNPYLATESGRGGDGVPFPGFLSALRAPRLGRSRGGPTSQLHYHLEECYEQWRVLEKERKKTEVVLAKSYPGKRMSVVSSNTLPKVPPNPSRVDRLIVDQLREQAKVMSVLGKMERLRSFPLHANICSALDRHLEAIYITQARRKDEYINISNRHRQGPAYFREDRDILLLASALKDLSGSTRKSRTALWCALQMTLPKTGHTDEQGDRDGGACTPLEQDSPDSANLERAHATF